MQLESKTKKQILLSETLLSATFTLLHSLQIATQ